MWNETVENKLSSLCQEYLFKNDSAHDLIHTRQVVDNAKRLNREIRCNESVLLPSAYLHDIVDRFSSGIYSDAPRRSAELGARILGELGFSQKLIGEIRECVTTASWEHAVHGGQPASIEAFVLRDADLLEAIGAHGIARVFSFAGASDRPLEWLSVDLANPPRLTPSTTGPELSPFYHFYSKLLWINDLFFSNSAKQEAEDRRAFLLYFLAEYDRENKWGCAC